MAPTIASALSSFVNDGGNPLSVDPRSFNLSAVRALALLNVEDVITFLAMDKAWWRELAGMTMMGQLEAHKKKFLMTMIICHDTEQEQNIPIFDL